MTCDAPIWSKSDTWHEGTAHPPTKELDSLWKTKISITKYYWLSYLPKERGRPINMKKYIKLAFVGMGPLGHSSVHHENKP